jgi:tellurite resistance protein TehA-like permease
MIALIVFLVFYIQAIFGLLHTLKESGAEDPNPFLILSTLFNPVVIISGLILAVSSLVYRILGIVHVARSKTAKDGEKALWIIGFIIMGFITAIVFLVMAKGRKFVD